jgi:DHA3 family macrolide efflux protein-like MFS transporter
LPLLVANRLGGATQLGSLTAVFGVGTIAGGILLAVWGGFKTRIYTSLAGLIGAGIATLALGLAPGLTLALAAVAGLGIMISLANGPIHAILQATVAPEFQGRVFSLYGSLAGMMTPLGLAIAAPVAEQFGVVVWFMVGGAACVTMGVVGFGIPSLVRIERGGLTESKIESANTLAEGT